MSDDIQEVLTLQQRMKRKRLLKRLAPRLARFRKIRKKRLADTDRLKKRARKQARQLLRKKVAGKRGEDYKNLSASGKIAVDKLVAKRGSAAIKKLSNRLLPKVRKAEISRVAKARQSNEEKMSFSQFFEAKSDGPAVKSAKSQIKRDKLNNNIKHDRMIDRARLTDARNKNRKSKPNAGVKVTVNAKESLERKAAEANLSYQTVKEQYDEAYTNADPFKRQTREQQAFARVNTYIANYKSGKD